MGPPSLAGSPTPRYFEEIFNASGNLELVKKYGDWFTYDKNPRAQIFRRNHSLVHDVDSMVRLMRWVLPPAPKTPPGCHLNLPADLQPLRSWSHRAHYIIFPPSQVQQLPAGPAVAMPGLRPPPERRERHLRPLRPQPLQRHLPLRRPAPALPRRHRHEGGDAPVPLHPPGTPYNPLICPFSLPAPGHLLRHGLHLRAGGRQRPRVGRRAPLPLEHVPLQPPAAHGAPRPLEVPPRQGPLGLSPG